MKGVVLAGGLGTRLLPLTKVINKHLLPVYDRPMISYPIAALLGAGINEILIVTHPSSADQFGSVLSLCDLGGAAIEYAYQRGHGGIADALMLAENFASGEPVCAILGDNVFDACLARIATDFASKPDGARVLLKEVPDPHRYGVAAVAGGRITSIEEKPLHPQSNLAVTGIYFYDRHVFERGRKLRPSARGELEITDLNASYLRAGKLAYDMLPGFWIDAGTFAGLHAAAAHAAAGHASSLNEMAASTTASAAAT